MRHAVLMGCNDFGVSGASLRGCLNDLRRMYYCIAGDNPAGWTVRFLADKTNTAEAQREVLIKTVVDAQPGNTVRVHDSSHGTIIPINGKIEHALCAYGFDWGDFSTFGLGSVYQSIFARKKDGVRIICTVDACNSGNIGQPVRGMLNPKVAGPKFENRFITPPFAAMMEIKHLMAQGVKAHPRGLMGDSDIVYVSACGPKDTDYSADACLGPDDPGYECQRAEDGNFWGGAFTWAWAPIEEARRSSPVRDVTNYTIASLKSNQYDQVPVINGDDGKPLNESATA